MSADIALLLSHRPQRNAAALAVLVGALAGGVFVRLLFCSDTPRSDLSAHVAITQQLLDGCWPPHFLFHLLVATLAGGERNFYVLSLAAIVVLMSAVAAKIYLSELYLRRAGAAIDHARLLAIILAVTAPVLSSADLGNIYLGQIATNVWHNPTTVLVVPLSIILFGRVLALRAQFCSRNAAWLSLVLMSSVLAKPNYVLALAPAMVITGIGGLVHGPWRSEHGWARMLGGLLLVAIPTGSVLAWQFHMAYAADDGSRIVVAPLSVWHMLSDNVARSLLVSLVFPIVHIMSFPSALRKMDVQLAWLTLVIAVAQAAFLAEDGPRADHANFFWGSYVANYILFLVCAADLTGRDDGLRSRVCWLALFAHFATGLVYLCRLQVSGMY